MNAAEQTRPDSTTNDNLEKFNDSRSFYLVLMLIIIMVLSPNLFIVSSDDINFLSSDRPLLYIARSQASDGRYFFSLAAWMLDVFHVGFLDFRVLSLIFLAAALTYFLASIRRTLTLNLRNSETMLFFILLLSFGLLLDLYRFVFAYGQYGMSFLMLGVCIHQISTQRRLLVLFLISTFAGWVGLGFYQLYLSLFACLLVGGGIIHACDPRADSARARACVPRLALAGGGSLVAGALYFVTNASLKAVGQPWFQNYPARPQSVHYIIENISQYIHTIYLVSDPSSREYGYFFSPITHLLLASSLVVILYYVCRHRFRLAAFLICLLAAVLLLPNPTNLLLQIYWPSPRSLAGDGFLCVSVLLGAYLIVRHRVGATPRLVLIPLCLVTLQLGVVVAHYAARYLVTQADFSLAGTIVARTYELTGRGRPMRLRLYTTWADVTVRSPNSFGYGASLFSESWGREGLIRYLSDGRIVVSTGTAEDCRDETQRLSIVARGDSVVACLVQN